MVVGFLGTLIGLERAVALEKWWPYGVPLFAALSILFILAGIPLEFGALSALLGSIIMSLVFIALYRQAPSPHFVTMALSGAAWSAGNCLWLAGFPVYSVAPWWVGFLVLMIAGERLELSRIIQPSLARRVLFHLCIAIIVAGLIYSLFSFYLGVRVGGIGLLALSLWLMRHDIAWRTIRQAGLSRFMAVCLLAGYFWLAVGGLLWFVYAGQFVAGLRYDAMLHAIFLGFVLSMIFAHAPVILPLITGVVLPYQPMFYGHVVLLHASLLLRITADMMLWRAGQQWGGVLNVAAVLLFLINNVYTAQIASRAH